MNFRLSILAAAFLTANASAVELGNQSFDPEFVTAMERDLGIAEAELPDYIRAEGQAIELEAIAKIQLGDNFAGSWLERQADGKYQHVIATAGKVDALKINGVSVVQANYSLSQLEGTIAGLNETIKQMYQAPILTRDFVKGGLDDIHTWYVDTKSNSVVLTVAEGSVKNAVDFVAASGVDIDTVRIEASQGKPATAVDVYGGRNYRTGGGSCSIGFSVTRGSTRGFVTAGHCGSRGTRVSIGGASVGSVQGSSFPTDDLAWANVRSSDRLLPFVDFYNGGSVQDFRIRGSSVASIGAAVCRSGFASGLRCGSITARNMTVNYSNGPVFGLTRSNACLTQGDSGGSWVSAGGQAQGVSSGGQLGGGTPPLTNCNFSNPVSFFQPVNEILSRFGLSLAR